MPRLKSFFAVFLLLLAVPVWRYLDMSVFLWPHPFIFTFFFTLWTFLFLGLPLWLLRPAAKPKWIVTVLLLLSLCSWFVSPLSKMATTDPEFRHCGALTYTGVFYHARGFLTYAHQDDLEARNQLCWIRKLIGRLPREFSSEAELRDFERLTQQKLLKPEQKYRASLPLIAILYGSMNLSWGDLKGGFNFFDSLHFWRDQYTVEITDRDYPLWNQPHAAYMKFEYGLVEDNWQGLLDSITVEFR